MANFLNVSSDVQTDYEDGWSYDISKQVAFRRKMAGRMGRVADLKSV